MDAYREAEERHFRLLYFTYIDAILQSADVLKSPIERLIAAFRLDDGARGLAEFDLNQDLNAYAYLNRYGPLSSGLVRQRILEALTHCQELRSKIRMPELKILDLGSGPGTDVIGFCSAVWEMFQREPDAPQCERLEFTLVDCIENWRRISRELEHLIRENDCGFVSTVFQRKEVSMEFPLGNLNAKLDNWPISEEKIKEAHIILVARLLLQLKFHKRFVKMIGRHMNPDSIVVFIEPRSYMSYILQEQNNFELIYEHPLGDGEEEPPEPFQLQRAGDDEQFPEYRRNVCLESSNRIFVFRKSERGENSSRAEENDESSDGAEETGESSSVAE